VCLCDQNADIFLGASESLGVLCGHFWCSVQIRRGPMWSDKPHRAILSQDCQAFFDPHFIMVMTIKCIMLCLLNRSLYLRLAVTLKCGPQYIVATDNISRVSVLNIVNIVVRFGDKSNVHEYSPLR